MSWSRRKYVIDQRGLPLFSIRRRRLALRANYYGVDYGTSRKIFWVLGRWSRGSPATLCYFESANGRLELARIGDDFCDARSHIIDRRTRQPLARIQRNYFNSIGGVGDPQIYSLTVAPNVDIAIVAAMCICLDEHVNKDRSR